MAGSRLLVERPVYDEVVERIYFGRRMKNDTDRLESLFALYRKAVAR